MKKNNLPDRGLTNFEKHWRREWHFGWLFDFHITFPRTYIAWISLSHRTTSLPPNQCQLRTIDITFVLHDGNGQYWKHACLLYVWNWKEVVVFDSLYCFSSQTSAGKKKTQVPWTHAEDVSLVNIAYVHKVCNFTVLTVLVERAKGYYPFLSKYLFANLPFDVL